MRAASSVVDAVILTDNRREQDLAFWICRITVGNEPVFNCRDLAPRPPAEISSWLDSASPHEN
jgi:hypothetical protein